MRHVSRRAAVVLLLAGLVLAGLLVFLIQYVFQAKSWAAFPGSPHVYRGNNLTAGTVTDRGGELLLCHAALFSLLLDQIFQPLSSPFKKSSTLYFL